MTKVTHLCVEFRAIGAGAALQQAYIMLNIEINVSLQESQAVHQVYVIIGIADYTESVSTRYMQWQSDVAAFETEMSVHF